ncbi:hypothetical protein [Vibrio sp. FJH11]
MQGAPISSWIAAKENKPRLEIQAGFYFISDLPLLIIAYTDSSIGADSAGYRCDRTQI